MENFNDREAVASELLRVGALVEAWENAGCGACDICEACETLNENLYDLRVISLFFENYDDGEISKAFYFRAREIEELPDDDFILLSERVEALVQEPEFQRSLEIGGSVSRAELEFWGEY